MNIIDVINLIKGEENLTKGEISAKIGIKQSYLSDMIAGRKPVSFEMKYKINKAFPYCYANDFEKNNKSTQEENKHKTLPLIPIDAIAGVPAGDFSGVRFEDCEQYRIPDFESKGAEFLIRVNGSSMYPKYSNGDLLACKKIEEILFIQWGKVYVIDSSQGSLVKRLFEDKENKENLICVSDNKENYPPFSIPKSDIRSLSIVVGVIRLE